MTVKQVGGDHYQSDYIHWDWVLAIGMQYLEGNATKYLARWQKKGKPLQDLEKALSYVQKLQEQMMFCAQMVQRTRPAERFVRDETARFLSLNDLHAQTASAIAFLATWTCSDHLQHAANNIRQLIEVVKRHPPGAPKPVPLEDSNKHALFTDNRGTD